MPLVAPPPIESARLRLRRIAESDLPALLEVNGDDEVTRFLPYDTWRSLADAQAWYQRMDGMQKAGSALQFAVADRRTDRALGSCLLFRFEERSARAEVGFVLGRAAWGHGYMTEALAALVECAFTTLGLRRLEAEVDPSNRPSRRVVQRVGFVREGLLRERWVDKHVAADTEIYGLLRREWRSSPA